MYMYCCGKAFHVLLCSSKKNMYTWIHTYIHIWYSHGIAALALLHPISAHNIRQKVQINTSLRQLLARICISELGHVWVWAYKKKYTHIGTPAFGALLHSCFCQLQECLILCWCTAHGRVLFTRDSLMPWSCGMRVYIYKYCIYIYTLYIYTYMYI